MGGEASGKVAFVTGGGGGIGFTLAGALGDIGASVVLADIDGERAADAAGSLQAKGVEALGVRCDVTAEAEVESTVGDVVSRFGGIDILLNVAGKHLNKYNQPFSVLPRDELRALLEVNVVGVVNCSVACLPTMKERGGGVIVNIASVASDLLASPYGISKLAVRGLTAALAQEFGPHGIRVNGISPGVVLSGAVVADFSEEQLDMVVRRQIIKRRGAVEDLVAACLFLVSDGSSFVTGETITVSGGWPITL